MVQIIDTETIKLLPPQENKVIVLKGNGSTITFNDPEEGIDFLKCFFGFSSWDCEKYFNGGF